MACSFLGNELSQRNESVHKHVIDVHAVGDFTPGQ